MAPCTTFTLTFAFLPLTFFTETTLPFAGTALSHPAFCEPLPKPAGADAAGVWLGVCVGV